MQETPFFFPHQGHQLFGVLHQPEAPNGRGFVFCHPFAEEKLWAHRVYVNYARELSRAGYAVLRFDYRGHGDSSGSFEDFTLESRLSDIACAVSTLQARVGGLEMIGLLGLRFGATLAALAANAQPNLKPLVLWEPIASGSQYMKELIRVNLATQSAVYKEIRHNTQALVAKLKAGETINVDGYDIRYPLYEQMMAIKLAGERHPYPGKVLLIQVNKKEGLGMKRVAALAAGYSQVTCIDVVEQPFWKEIREYYAHAKQLFAQTTRWITNNE